MDVIDQEFRFNPCVVIEFDAKCPFEVKSWLNSKLTASKESRGAQLLTTFKKNSKNEVKQSLE